MIKSRRKNFLGLSHKYSNFKNSKLVIIPFGMEFTTCFGKGTKNGPSAIIDASYEVELFDEELQCEPYKTIGLFTMNEVKINNSSKSALVQLENIVKQIIRMHKLPVVIGGEHTLTTAVVKALKTIYKNFSILQLDAHADLRNSYQGNSYSHACVMRRCMEVQNTNLVQIGVRSISNETGEFGFLRKNKKRINTFWIKDKKNWKIKKILNTLKKNVHITLDVDVFDPSIMPSTGTPCPDGLNFKEVLTIIKEVAKTKKIIGFDVVEFSPIKGLIAPDITIAKLIYKIISYIRI